MCGLGRGISLGAACAAHEHRRHRRYRCLVLRSVPKRDFFPEEHPTPLDQALIVVAPPLTSTIQQMIELEN